MTNLVFGGLRGRLKKTGQTTTYNIGDDGDYEKGLSQVYTVYTTGQYSGTTTFDVAHYANNGISFTAPATIADAAAGLVTVLTNDVVRIRGSAANDGVYTVTAGGVAGSFTVAPNVVDEAAGAYVTIYKEAAISNNAVWDRRTGLMWLRNTTTGLKIGPASTGTLNWYDATTCFTLHPAAADLQIIAAPSNILRIVGGAAEASRYNVGDLLDLTGFATAVNNIPGYRVLSVTVNGLDLDIVLDPVKSVLAVEAAGGARSILLVCRSVFAYCAAANAAVLGGWSDWRIPNISSLIGLMQMVAASAVPDAVAFPGWPASTLHSSTSRPGSASTTTSSPVYSSGLVNSNLKTTVLITTLIRGGI